MAYCTTCDLYALVRPLIAPASAFDTATCPTYAQADAWIVSGCSAINTQLAAHGYGAIPATSPAYGLAQQANATFGAWFAERSRINARVSADERTRADMFKRDYEALMEMLVGMDLAMAGVPIIRSALPYAGGISVSDKDAIEADTGRVAPRFTRGMGRNPERGS